MTPEQKETYDLVKSGLSLSQVAAKLGIERNAAKSRWRRAKVWADADPAAQNAAKAAQSNALPHSFWVKTDTHSIYYKTPQEASENDFLDRVADAFKDIPSYDPPTIQSEHARNDLMTVYPLFDAHFGMHAWAKETGSQDYDLEHAEQDMRDAFGSLCNITPIGSHALLILGGDTLHIDDARNETPASGHKLDVDGRYFKVLDIAIRSLCWTIDHLANMHATVKVRVLRGNHDPQSHMVLTFALSERYRKSTVVTIDKDPRDLLMVKHGRALIAAHHGDKSPPQRLAMMIADVCPWWSDTRDRHILSGHIHHDSVKDFPGIKWHSLRAFCPPDAYGANFAPRRALQAMVFDATKGHIMTAVEPVMRE